MLVLGLMLCASRRKNMNKEVKRKNKGLRSVRIIGGEWRGSRLPIPDCPGLRPSGERCRETLFSWLQPYIHNSVCVDLFAGSGALGMEAASRGAAQVILVEKLAQAARILQRNIERLNADNVSIMATDAVQWLHDCQTHSMDIAFIDPPFGLHLETRAWELIRIRDCIKPGGRVYLETAASAPLFSPGPGWEVAKEKMIGEVRMLLLKKN
jgi:16S rRNA (guanine966-N2)-methyltransferase